MNKRGAHRKNIRLVRVDSFWSVKLNVFLSCAYTISFKWQLTLVNSCKLFFHFLVFSFSFALFCDITGLRGDLLANRVLNTNTREEHKVQITENRGKWKQAGSLKIFALFLKISVSYFQNTLFLVLWSESNEFGTVQFYPKSIVSLISL